MPKTSPEILDYYDEQTIGMITEKYGIDPFEALRRFLASQTYAMLSDAELEMWDFGPPAIFEMWENEQITGDPRNSRYIRSDDAY